MNILYYTWNENSANDMIGTLKKLDCCITVVSFPFADYNDDNHFCSCLKSELEKCSYDGIFTFDFFPLISRVAQNAGIPYISWIYDMPHNTLCAPEIKNETNYIFVFDNSQYQLLLSKKYSSHIFHMPLAVNVNRLNAMLGEPSVNNGSCFDVSFVGSLYENCLYNQINYIPEYLSGYLDGIMNSQMQIYGENIVYNMLNHNILEQLEKYVKLNLPDTYDVDMRAMFADIINAKITSTERINLLNSLSEKFKLTLFSASSRNLVPKALYGGVISYEKEMPGVFRASKINLNITLRSITYGIPLRALDVMGAGGFLLSNYQTELAEYFSDGNELVLYDSEDDMLGKTEYYLTHEKERLEIAYNGFNRVSQEFSYENQVRKILKTVFNT